MRAPTDGEAFSDAEEEFFRAGDALDNASSADEVIADEAAPPHRRAWTRWFARSNRAVTEPSIVENDNRGTPVA